MNLRRIAIPAAACLLILAASAILWSLAYASVTSVAFRDIGLLKAVTQADPFASIRHLQFYSSDTRVVRHGVIAAAATFLALGGLGAFLFFVRPPSTFGDARFASGRDIFRANLHARTGLILGRHGHALLRHDEPGHILVEGPTRSGKGQGFVEPNGLTWQGTLICLDPKQENFKAFAATRLARGDQVFLFAPGSVRSHRYNPLDFVRRGPEMATDLANLAAFLIPEPRGDAAFWASSARNLFAACLGYVLETPLFEGSRHISSVLSLFSSGTDIADRLTAIVKTERAHLPGFVVDQFNQFIPMPEKTRGSVTAHLIDALKPWNNPLIIAATAASDFNLRELREKPISIFIGAPIADLESFRPLIRVLVQQIHDQLMRELPQTDDTLPVLMLLDEFPALQRMDALVAKLAVSAGFGIRMAIVVQALSQLDELYGRATRETILANTDIKLFAGTNDQASADYISQALGMRTAMTKSISGMRSQNPFSPRTVTRSEAAAPLMRPEQIRTLDRRKAILLLRGERPILLDKIICHRERMFQQLKRAGRSVFLSVPELQAAPRISASLAPVPHKEMQPTPSSYAPRERPDPRQQELPLQAAALESSATRTAPLYGAGSAITPKSVARPIPAGNQLEDRLGSFLHDEVAAQPERRAEALREATREFLMPSRRLRQDLQD